MLIFHFMITLRILMLLAAVAVCYLLSLHMGATAAAPPTGAAHLNEAGLTDLPLADAHQYKEIMDKAHAAAQQMQAQKAEADAL